MKKKKIVHRFICISTSILFLLTRIAFLHNRWKFFYTSILFYYYFNQRKTLEYDYFFTFASRKERERSKYLEGRGWILKYTRRNIYLPKFEKTFINRSYIGVHIGIEYYYSERADQ